MIQANENEKLLLIKTKDVNPALLAVWQGRHATDISLSVTLILVFLRASLEK